MRKPLLSTTILALAMSGGAAAQTTTEAVGAGPSDQLDAIVVTGTRQSNRPIADSPAPIQVLSEETLQPACSNRSRRRCRR